MNSDSDYFDYYCDCCGKGYYAEVGFDLPTCCSVEEQARARRKKETPLRGMNFNVLIIDEFSFDDLDDDDDRPY